MMKNRPASALIRTLRITTTGAFLLSLAACGSMNPHNVDVQLEKSAPEVKITSYTKALSDIGNMSVIYDTGAVKLQSTDITDKTGAAMTTGGEIQRNITEIMKSTLNAIGGNIIFIEYDPSFIQNQMVTGYSQFKNKVIPDVVITGGITEFDRGLETRGTGTDASISAKVKGAPTWFPSDEFGGSMGNTAKEGKARITLDFNMKDFQTLAGIAKMTTTNSMVVHKAVKEKEVGLTLFGPTFGLKGSIKKVQGRHEAVRLLVQVSMIQLIGKYLAMPYWRVLGEDAKPDPVVMNAIALTYGNMSAEDRISSVQQWLFIHGNDLDINGELDQATRAAIKKFDPSVPVDSLTSIPLELFQRIYISMPFDTQAMVRRNKLNQILNAKADAEAAAAEQTAATAPQEQYQPAAQQQAAPAAAPQQAAPAPAPQQAAAPQKAPAPAPKAKKPVRRATGMGFGRMLNEDEW